MADLFTFGEALALFLAKDTDSVATAREFTLEPAGAEANVAVAVTRLGLTCMFQSRLGTDQLGDVIISELMKENIDVSRVKRVENYTGSMARNRGTTQSVNATYMRKSSAASTMEPSDLNISDIQSCRWLHATGITAAISESARLTVAEGLNIARTVGIGKSFDLNVRRKLWSDIKAREVLIALAKDVDILFGGEDEYQLVWESQDPKVNLKRATDQGNTTAIMTAGPELIRVLRDGIYFEISPPVVKAVDPVGSGDAFVAGTLAGLLSGLELKEAIIQGSENGAAVAASIGDWTGLLYGVGGRKLDDVKRNSTP